MHGNRKQYWPHELVLGLIPLLVGFEILASAAYFRTALQGIADFRQLYIGGYMVRTGQGSGLYDYDRQQELANKLAPVGVRFPLPVNHLAYEELLFAPLSLLSYRNAFMVFLGLNVGILVLSIYLLRANLRCLSQRWKPFPALLVVGFFPIIRTLMQGQDSILLLALLAGALISMQSDKDLAAGLLTGLGLFKFQIVLPIALLFFFWKRWRFCAGFAVTSSLAICLSLVIVRWQGFKQYASMLFAMSLQLRPGSEAVIRYATVPNGMLNLRGLISGLFGEHLPHSWVQGIILLSSLVVLLLATKLRPSLPVAITTASLVSYHFIAHDAAVMVIPMGMALCTESLWMTLSAIALLIIPAAAILPQYGYLAALPILALFLGYRSSQNHNVAAVQMQKRQR